ncbi:MAG: hypothetical protein ACYTE3_10645 [Planctomycetota bacterium]|jgi:hypothetical protein
MDASLIMFGIESGVKLGRKIYDVLVDADIERPLLLPVGNLYADVTTVVAMDYFFNHPELIAPPSNGKPKGQYYGYSEANLILAYKTLRSIDERVSGEGGEMRAAVEIVRNLDRFEQYRKEARKNKPAVYRLLGTLLEIGIDYFVANPDALGRDSNARKIVHSFIVELDETDFAEGSRREIIGDLLGASLRVLDSNLPLIEDDERMRALLGGITKALIADIDTLTAAGASEAKLSRREELFRRIGSSIMRGAAGAFGENIDLFMRNGTAKTLVQSTLTQVLEGIEGKADIFTNESIELLYKSALNAVGDNPELFSGNEFVQALIGKTVKALAKGDKVFSEETFGAVVQAALEVARDNAEMLFDPDDPQEQLLASAVGAMASSLSSTLAGGGTAKDLLSKTQLVELAQVVFQEVAKHPEHLIGGEADDVRMTALAQIIGSVVRSLGENPALLITGEGFVSLVRDSIRVAVLNADKLIDFGAPNTSRNLLFKILHQVAQVIEEESNDPRGLVTREVFLEIVERILPVASANLALILDGQPNLVRNTVRTSLGLASDVLTNRTNGANLPDLIEELLRRVLWGELKLNETGAVLAAANEALRAAS